MSPDEQSLLAAVAADPASDLPRLVYADWLDDHGQAIRAEFVRLQCEIAKLEVGPRAEVDRNWRLWKRQQDLLDDYLPELLGPAAFLAECRPILERGFPASARLGDAEFVRHATQLAALTPRPRLHVDHDGGRPPTVFLSSPHLDRVTGLSWANEWASGDDLYPVEPVRALVGASGRLIRLDELEIGGWVLSDAHAELLAAADFPALRSLDLGHNELSDAGVVALLAAPYVRRLARIRLDNNPIGDQAAFELADRLGKVATFRTLDFRRTRVSSAGQAALTAAFGGRCNLF